MSSTPINTSDPDAIERLEAKMAKLDKEHKQMKAANKIAKHKTMDDENKIIALEKLGFTKKSAHELLNPPQAYYGLGFPSYSLAYNRTAYRTAKKRLESVKTLNQEESHEEEIHGVTVEWDLEDGRVRLHFPTPGGRVSDAMYKVCRTNGFVFARSLDAFSRKWTNNTAKSRVQSVLAAYKAELDEKAEVPEAA